MKPKTAGTLSVCVVWIIVFGTLSACLLPIAMAMMVEGFSSASPFAMQTIAPIICPDGTTTKAYSCATTTTMNMAILNRTLLMNYIVLT